MERLTLSGGNEEVVAERAAEVVSSGGVILYPTDTVYGLGGDALSDGVVEKVVRIKGRDTSRKYMLALASDMEMIECYAEMNESARSLARHFFPGPLTLVLNKKEGETGIRRDIATIGVRIPDNRFCLALARAFGGLIISTSANVSGEPVQATTQDILKQLGPGAQMIDLVIDAGPSSGGKPSSVVDVSDGSVRILRAGVIPEEAILAVP